MEIRLCPSCRQAREEVATCPDCREHVILVDAEYFVGSSFGKYRLDSVLGVGGMGVVYRAVHADLGKAVALKLLVPEGRQGDFVKRFRNEAKVLATLKHPHIVEVFDLDVSESGLPYYVMQLLEGQSLRAHLAGYPRGLPLQAFQRFVRQIGSALAYTHGKGIIHRDLKPENVFVEEVDGETHARVLDFGIAKMVAPDSQASTMTQTGLILGTPHYMAPEQITGVDMGPHTDQYAFALICWEMLTGKGARQGKTVGEILSQEIRRPVGLEALPPGGIQERFGPVLTRATAPDHHQRYPSVHAFVEALFGNEEMETGKTRVSLAGSSGWGTAAPPPRRRRAFRIGAALAALVLLTLGGAWMWRHYAGEGGMAVPPPEEEALLAPQADLPVPPDAEAILDSREGVLLKGAGALLYLDPANPSMPSRFALEPGEELVAGLQGEGLALARPGTLVVATYAANRREERARYGLEDGERVVAVSPSGEGFAALGPDGLTFRSPASGRNTSIPGPFSAEARFAAGEHTLAAADGGQLTVWDGVGGRLLYRTSVPSSGLGPLALLEEAGLAAAGGWFDEVFVADFKAGRTDTVVLPGQTQALRFIPDAPSLLIAKNDALHLWRGGAGVVGVHRSPGARFKDVRLTGAGLLVLDAAGRRLRRLAYPGFPLRAALAAGNAELWALTAAGDGRTLFAGGFDGLLYSIDTQAGVVTSHELHTQGITALLCHEDVLASASDDKTIALRKLPSMDVFWRSQAHDYLINALQFSPAGRTLWSSSSDGKLKSWRWPQLAEVEEIVTGAGNHAALWVSGDETLILAGTWKRMLVVLEKTGGRWTAAQVFRVPCQAVYSIAHLPGEGVALMIGAQPGAVFVYDLEARRLHRAPNLGLDASWALPAGPSTGIVTGTGGLLRYAFRREGGALRVSIALAVNPRVGTIGVACPLDPGGLAMGTATGEVLLADLASVPFVDLTDRALDDPLPPALVSAPLPFRLDE